MTTNEKIINALMEAAETLHFVEKDGDNRILRIEPDYRETNDWLLSKAFEAATDILENYQEYGEDPDMEFLYRMTEKIDTGYEWVVGDFEDEIIKSAAVQLGIDAFDCDARQELREMLWDSPLSILPDYDHFLNQTMKVNLIFATDEERNLDCNLVSEQGDSLL